MQSISVYDTEAKTIQQIADDNDLTECEVVEYLMDYVEQMKEDYGLKTF